MTINPSLLIAAPMLQDYLVDKDTGLPLSAGIVTLYNDNARSFFKNWYYQTGVPGAYNWIPLDNPLTLSSVGTIQDPNGNDVIPFYYPFSEDDENEPQPYYITVYNSNAVLQFTRENFPYNPSENNPSLKIPTYRNYIINNIYWRNIGNQNLSSVTQMVIAPSQHEGYTNGDIQFLKSKTGATDALSFPAMTSILQNDITPEFCLNMQCTASTTGESQKCIQYPISLHVNTLNSISGTIKIYAQNVSSNPNNFINLYFYQFLGTGVTSPAPILINTDGPIVLNSNFQEYLIPFTTPSTTGLTLGTGGDDALFLQVQFPLNLTFNINHTKPQIYFSDNVPTNDFDTYDQIESIINSPRTGDFRISLNSFQPFGWVACNDGTIGNPSSGATRSNFDTWPLYNLIWNSVGSTYAPLFNSSGGSISYGANAYTDFSANNRLSLTKQLGRIIASVGTPSSGTNTGNNWALGQTTGNEEAFISTSQLSNHTHVAASGNFFESGIPGTQIGGTLNPQAIQSNQTGGISGYTSQTPLIMQPPTVYANVFLKL